MLRRTLKEVAAALPKSERGVAHNDPYSGCSGVSSQPSVYVYDYEHCRLKEYETDVALILPIDIVCQADRHQDQIRIATGSEPSSDRQQENRVNKHITETTSTQDWLESKWMWAL